MWRLTLLFIPLLAACTASQHDENVLRFASMKDVRDLNPHLYGGEMPAQNMLFEGLVKNTPQGVAPALATSWDVSADGLTYVFHLRRGVSFSDGTPFDAAAVDANVKAVLANRTRHAWLELVNEIAEHRVVDDHTWALKLKRPYFPTLVELGLIRPFRFLSPKCFKDGGTMSGTSCLSGTGPWMLAEHETNRYALFKPNPNYWGEKPRLAGVRWNVIPDAQTLLMSLQKGDVDLVFGADGDQLSANAFASLAKEGKFVTQLSAPTASRAILLNSARGALQDARVREAIQYAVNRNDLVEHLLSGSESPAEKLFADNVPYVGDVGVKVRAFDPERAAALLDEAGWTLSPEGLRMKDRKPLTLVFSYNAQNVQEKTIAQAVQSNLAKLGVTVRLLGEEKQAFLNRQRDGEFDMQYSLSWGAPYDPQSFFSSWRIPSHGDYQAQSGLPDKATIDREISDFLVAVDVKQRRALAADIVKRVESAAVYLPISFARTKVVHSVQVKDVGFGVSQYEIPFYAMCLEGHCKRDADRSR